MSTDREVTRIVRSWLHKDEHESAETLLGTVLDRLDTTPQRRQMWRAWRPNLMNGTLRFAAAAIAVVAMAGIGLAIYFSRPAVDVGATPSPFQSPLASSPMATAPVVAPATDEPSTGPSVTVQPNGTPATSQAPWILFHWRPDAAGQFESAELWAMRADGTGAHELDLPSGMSEFAWSKDGTRLLAASAAGGVNVFVAEVDDEIGGFVDIGFETDSDTACHEKSREPLPCQDAAFDFAPDGERIVFVQRCTYELPGCYFLTTLNLVTGERTEIYQSPPHRGGLAIELPAWSPDGTQIAFGQARADNLHTDLWVINADGTNPRQIGLGDDLSYVKEPRWSPDGTRIAFSTFSDTEQMAYAINSDPENMGGAAVSSFTAGDRVCCAEWINNSQVRVLTLPESGLGGFNFFLADDHSGASGFLLGLDDAFAAIEPPGHVTQRGVPGDPGRTFLWQPTDQYLSE